MTLEQKEFLIRLLEEYKEEQRTYSEEFAINILQWSKNVYKEYLEHHRFNEENINLLIEELKA